MLAPWNKSCEQPDSILKSRDITLPTKVRLVKAMVYPIVMYGFESWTIKKAERRRIDALELWCWRRLLRVPWTAKRSNQSILKEISPEYSLEGLMLNTLATWLEELTHLKRPWCWERLKAEGEGDDRGWDDWTASPTWWTWVWASSRSWWWTGRPGTLQSMGSKRVGHNWVTELNWTGCAILRVKEKFLKFKQNHSRKRIIVTRKIQSSHHQGACWPQKSLTWTLLRTLWLHTANLFPQRHQGHVL